MLHQERQNLPHDFTSVGNDEPRGQVAIEETLVVGCCSIYNHLGTARWKPLFELHFDDTTHVL